MDTCRYYPKFEPNQVLTAEQLNQVTSYLNTHDRLTRALLIGVGPLCGLRVTKTVTDAPKITISRGVGVTTHGYLMEMPRQEFTRYRSYADPVRYDYFWDGDSQIELWELLPERIDEEEEGISPLNHSVLQNKAVVLYLEIKEVDLETCTGDDCDEKGTRVELCIKPLLVKFSDLNTIIAEAHEYADDTDLETEINGKYKLPDIGIGRPNAIAGFDEEVYYPQIHEAYLKVIERDLSKIKSALSCAYKCYQPLLQPQFPADAINLSDLEAWFGNYQEHQSPGIQYFYNFLKDLILAYNEFTSTAFDVLTACVPEKAWFPRHLMLGPAIPEEECEPSIYRERFIASPIHEHLAVKSDAVLSLYRRLVMMVKNFNLPDPGEAPIRVTPSAEDETPLSVRSIPYYYSVEKEFGLHHYWNHDYQRTCRSELNLGYHADLYQDESTPPFASDPLDYDTDKYPFYRIEGHLGYTYEKALGQIREIIRNKNLPVKVLGLKLGKVLPDDEFGDSCRFEDLAAIYSDLKGDLRCWLEQEIKYFSTIKYADVEPEEQEGITGIKGRVTNRSGEPVENAGIYSSSGEKIASSLKDGTFGPVQLSPKIYDLIIHHTDYEVRQRRINLKENSLLTLNIRLNPKDSRWLRSISDVSYGRVGAMVYKQPEEVMDLVSAANVELTSQPEAKTTEELFPGEKTSLAEYQTGEYFRKSISGATYEYTVGDVYQSYTLSRTSQDLLSFTHNILIADPVINNQDIADIMVVNVYYPLQIIEKIEALLRTLTSSLKQLNLGEFQSKYDILVSAAESYREQLQSELSDKISQLPVEKIREIRKHLERIINSCHKSKFENLHEQYQERFEEIRRLRLFGSYIQKHPGMEHQAGVPKGGTFFLVYDDQQRVVADFMLPYVCCSDCPPVALCETNPVVFKLPKDRFCSGDETDYRFILSPPGGTVTGPGVSYDEATGDYYFSPDNDDIQGEKAGFKYSHDEQEYRLEVTIIDLTADLVYKIQNLDMDSEKAVVGFNARPEDADSYHWDFGDGESSEMQNPKHTYDLSEGAEFQVSLTVKEDVCEEKVETTIEFDMCSAEFTYEILEQNADEARVQFTSAMENADEFAWDFSDDTEGSTESNPEHTFDLTRQTEYSVTLRVKKGVCEDEEKQTIVFESCDSEFDYTIIEQTPDFTQVAFQPAMENAETYRWDFGDGSEGDDRFEQQPVHTYSLVDGGVTFDISLRVTRGICQDQTQKTLKFEPCNAGFSFEVPEHGPDSAQVRFTPEDSEADHYQWDFGDGSAGSEEINPSHTFQIDGQESFTVSLSVSKGVCSATSSETVTLETCSAAFSYDILQREGNSVKVQFTPEMADAESYLWDFDTGDTSDESNPDYTFDSSDRTSFNVSLSVTNGLCSDSQETIVTFESCDADFAYEVTERNPQSVEVQFRPLMEDARSYVWDFGDGSAKSSAVAPTHVFDLSRTQTFIVTLNVRKETCEDIHEETLQFETCTAEVQYEVLERSDQEIVIQFTAAMQDADGYQWDFGDGTDSSVEPNPQHTFGITDVDQVKVSLQVKKGACSDTQSQTILVAQCTARFDYEIIEWSTDMAQVQFTPVMKDADFYRWDFGDQTEPSGEQAPMHYYKIGDQNIFKVTLTVAKPNCEDQYSERIVIDVLG